MLIRRDRIDYSTDITVLVSKEEKRFTLHTSVATANSAFFRAACNGKFQEAADKTIRLPEVQSADFETYMQWAYTGMIVLKNEATNVATNEATNEATQDDRRAKKLALHKELTRLYVLADRVDDMCLRNAVIDEFINRGDRSGLGVFSTSFAYKHTPDGSTLRALIANTYASLAPWNRLGNNFKENKARMHEDFIFDMLVLCIQGGATRPTWQNRCEFHEHNDEVPKCV